MAPDRSPRDNTRVVLLALLIAYVAGVLTVTFLEAGGPAWCQ